jgi:hypothetical protein
MELDSPSTRFEICGGERRTSIEVSMDAETLRRLEELPDAHSTRKREFTVEEDAVILKYWPVKNKDDVSRILGLSENTVRNRYKELKGRV